MEFIMKHRKLSVTVAASLFTSLIALNAPAADAPAAGQNLLRNGDVEAYAEGPVPQEQFDTFWAPVSAALMDKNTFFNVVKGKAHGGEKSIRLTLTPESAQLWKQNPGKEGTDGLFLHYSLKPKTSLAPLAAEKVVFSVW